ncbi:MAG: hypothetical protein ACM3KE_03940 [Hyphomicrobiales bacterium]
MKMRALAGIVMGSVWISLLAASPSIAQQVSCYVTPGLEKTFVSVRELDQDGNPLEEIGRGWLNQGEQVAVSSRTGRIVINYQLSSSDKGIQTDPQGCSGGIVITVP